METKEFIISVFTENQIGLLGRITTIFTRRKLNIESLSVSETSIKGISMFTIVTLTSEDTIKKVVKHIERIVETIKAEYHSAENLISQQIALYKVSSAFFTDPRNFDLVIRNHNARIIEVNVEYLVLEKTGYKEEVDTLRQELEAKGELIQFTRSGTVVLHRGSLEEMLGFN